MAQEVIHEVLVDRASSTTLTVLVIFLLAVSIVSNYGIDEDVSWTRVKVVTRIYTTVSVWRDESYVGNASDVLACT